MNEFDNVVFLDQGEYDRYLLGLMEVTQVRVRSNGSVTVFLCSEAPLPLDWLTKLHFVVRGPNGKFDVQGVDSVFHTGSELVWVIITQPVGALTQGLRAYAAQLMTGPSVFVAAGESHRLFPLAS